MAEERRNLYEGMYIISATLSEEARGKAFDRIQTGITDRGGEVVKVHDLGRKRLAYEVAGFREGHYFLFYFHVKLEAIQELWAEYHLNEDLLRFITLRAAEDGVMETIEFPRIGERQGEKR